MSYEGDRLRAYIAALPAKADALAAKVALLVQEIAVRLAPKRTGNLARSISAVREAAGRWLVFVSVVYGIYVEFGTSRMSARPYFIPAFYEAGRQVGALAKEAFA